jgi:hypothetical protein
VTPEPARRHDPIDVCVVCETNLAKLKFPGRCSECGAVACPRSSARCYYVHLAMHAAATTGGAV